MKGKLLTIVATALLMFCIAGESSAGLVVASGDMTPAAYVNFYDNGVFFTNILQGGSSVQVHDFSHPSTGTVNAVNLTNFYNGLTGASNTYLGDTVITASSLSGLDLLITGLQTNGLTPSELVALNNFINSGGSVLFMGDYTAPETYINSALSYIGSSMSLFPPLSFPGNNNATGSEIVSDPLTAGVFNFAYGNTYGVSGGTPLFLDHSGRPFMAYETIVPVPAAAWLLGSGLMGLLAMARRKRV
jgi:hypothetical protein